MEEEGYQTCPPSTVVEAVATDQEMAEAEALGARPKVFSNVIVDESPLQSQLEKNKESLKVKLMVRRPITALVAQGILPSPKTSPALHEQRQKLERAKMGDMLRAKIAKRPDRQELVHRHILEDVRPGVDPSLCDKQRQLKRAKLIDSLSNQLLLRPGPLELVAKNILHAEDDFMEQAVKEGAIAFKPTNEGLPVKHVEVPSKYTIDEDSNSEPQSPQDLLSSASSGPVSQQCSPLPRELLGNVIKSESHENVSAGWRKRSESRRKSDAGPALAVPSPATPSSSCQSPVPSNLPYSQRCAPGKDRGKGKKTKQKLIKFHEYKGPGGSQKKSSASSEGIGNDANLKERSSYDLLLEQQQLYLQWQVEHKKFQKILPATSANNATSTQTLPSSGSLTPRAQTPVRITPHEVANAAKMLKRIDEMKVNELKSELRKRNLAVTGSKVQLVERLTPHLEVVVSATSGTPTAVLSSQTSTRRRPVKIAPAPATIALPSQSGILIVDTSRRQSKESSPSFLMGAPMDTMSQPSTPVSVLEGSPERNLMVDLMDQDSPKTAAIPPPPPPPPPPKQKVPAPPPPPPPPPPPSQGIRFFAPRSNGKVALMKQKFQEFQTFHHPLQPIQFPQVPLPESQLNLKPGHQNDVKSAEEQLIKQQQEEIERLKQSLARSQEALQMQSKNKVDDVRDLLTHQLQNQQIQINELQSMQQQIVSRHSNLLQALVTPQELQDQTLTADKLILKQVVRDKIRDNAVKNENSCPTFSQHDAVFKIPESPVQPRPEQQHPLPLVGVDHDDFDDILKDLLFSPPGADSVASALPQSGEALSSSASCSSDASTTSSTPGGMARQQAGVQYQGPPCDLPLDIKDLFSTIPESATTTLYSESGQQSMHVSESDVAGFLNSIVPSPGNPQDNVNVLQNNNLNNQMNNNLNIHDSVSSGNAPSDNLFDDEDMMMLHSPLSNWETGCL